MDYPDGRGTGVPEEMQLATDHAAIFGAGQDESDGPAADDLAPARSVLFGMLLGGILWILLIYILATVS